AELQRSRERHAQGLARPRGLAPHALRRDRGSPRGRQSVRREARAALQGALMAFTDELWKSIEPIYAAILRHPFLRGLTDGSLPRESFKFYAVQDALYLREFARALSLAGARAPQDDWIIMFNEHAAGALKVERELHASFFRDFGLSPEAVASTPLAPTNLAYTSYLLAVAYGSPVHEAPGAALPFYWVFWGGGEEPERARPARPP